MIPGKIIFKAVVGSQAYGTATPTSDIDIKGVYIQNLDDVLSFKYKEQIEVSKDEVYYEVKRFLQLAQTANPTMLELLFMPEDCILHIEPEFKLILKHKEKFLTKKCYNSFAGYAHQQIVKATGTNKKMNYEKDQIQKKTVIDFCYFLHGRDMLPVRKWKDSNNRKFKDNNYGLSKMNKSKNLYAIYSMDIPVLNGIESKDGTQIKTSKIPKGLKPFGHLYFNEEAYQQHQKDYKSYQIWLKERNESRFVDVKNHGQKIDGKNMLHCRRLIDVAKEIPVLKTINVKRPNAEYLLDIRKGKYDLTTILNGVKKDLEDLKELYNNSDLPDKVDFYFINSLLLEVRGYNN